jgi:hypothetical protein
MPLAALDQSIQVELKILIVLLVDNSGYQNQRGFYGMHLTVPTPQIDSRSAETMIVETTSN